MRKPELSIVMPVFNEDINIRIMVAVLDSVLDFPHEILVVHDTPDDPSVKVVKSLQRKYPQVRSVRNNRGRGVVNAIKAGHASVKGKYMLLFAVDELGPVLAISAMKNLLDSGCDFVSCTRYTHGGRRLGGSILGGFLSKTANFAFRFFSGSALSDATTGIKMFRKEVLDVIQLESRPVGWACVFELAVKAQMQGYALGEVPIDSIDRIYAGKSSFKPGPWIVEYLRWFFWGMQHLPLFRKRKKPMIGIPQMLIDSHAKA